MKAIRFNASIPRYALGKTAGKLSRSILWSGSSCTYASDCPQPDLPGDQWVKIRTRYGGICGSDLGTIQLHTSPYFYPYSSYPYTFGHENVGRIHQLGSQVDGFEEGQRVTVEPLLWCEPRGISKACRFCQNGQINLCQNMTSGDLAPGLTIGFCKDTGGSWSEYFVAHKSQLYPLPDKLSDENALLIDPLAVGIHAVLLAYPEPDQTVLIQGAGSVGLSLLAALRALGSRARVIVAARYDFQAQAARKLGADEIVSAARGNDSYTEIAELTNAKVMKSIIGKRVVTGGVDLTYECVGSDQSLDDSLRLTRSAGQVVLVGVPGIAKEIDWSSLFLKESTVRSSFCYNHAEQHEGQRWKTFDLAIDFLSTGRLDLSWMLTHKFSIDDYKRALQMLCTRNDHQVIKAAFEF